MRRVGTVVRTAQGLAVVRSPEDSTGETGGHPRIGTPLVDENLSAFGRVVDVFGPVERPYLAVKADVQPIAESLGTTVYFRE